MDLAFHFLQGGPAKLEPSSRLCSCLLRSTCGEKHYSFMPRTEAWGGGPALALERSLDAACEAAGAMEEMLRDMADDAKRVTTEASMCVGRMAALWWCWLAAAPTSRPSLSPRARCDVARRVDCRSPSPALVLLTHTSHTYTPTQQSVHCQARRARRRRRRVHGCRVADAAAVLRCAGRF